jgi:hypothetical protein
MSRRWQLARRICIDTRAGNMYQSSDLCYRIAFQNDRRGTIGRVLHGGAEYIRGTHLDPLIGVKVLNVLM